MSMFVFQIGHTSSKGYSYQCRKIMSNTQQSHHHREERTRVAIGVITVDGLIFIQQRRDVDEVQDGIWEFPGGKVRADETVLEGLQRELQEEIGLTMRHPTLVWRQDAELGALELFFFIGSADDSLHVELDTAHAYQGLWVPASTLLGYEMHKPNRVFIETQLLPHLRTAKVGSTTRAE